MYKLWLIHFDVQQKITQPCKATILQKKFFKEEYLINGLGIYYVIPGKPGAEDSGTTL